MKQLVSILSILFLVGCSQNQESKYSRGETAVDTTVAASNQHGSTSASVRAKAPEGYHIDYKIEVESGPGYSSSSSEVFIRSK
ncbi:MAG: hypothetical protein HGB18_01225 [Candidatus Moranbacteria bacterium]|nr:hypothetical protein [Candidatus Moranbacteria bacterium]